MGARLGRLLRAAVASRCGLESAYPESAGASVDAAVVTYLIEMRREGYGRLD